MVGEETVMTVKVGDVMKTEIYHWLEENNVHIAVLAFRSGLTIQTVRRWLNGKSVSRNSQEKIVGPGLRGVECPREIRRKFE